MKKVSVMLVCMAMVGMSVFADPGMLFKGDFKKLNDKGVPEGWSVQGKNEFKIVSDDESEQVVDLTAASVDAIYLVSPFFQVTSGKPCLVTFKFRSRNFGSGPYNKIDCSAIVRFKGSDGKDLPGMNCQTLLESPTPGQIGFPYGDVKAWTKKSINVIAPADAKQAYLQICLNNSKADDARPAIQICDLIVRAMAEEASGKPVVEVAAAKLATGSAADAATAIELPAKKAAKGNICFGPYAKLPPGIYDVTIRAKSADAGKANPILLISIETTGNMSGAFLMTGKDFKAVNEYQDFTFRVLKPDSEPLNLPCYKAADATLTLESLRVAPVKQFAPAELDDFYIQSGKSETK